MKARLVFLLLVLLTAAPAAAQSRREADRWQIALADGGYLWDVRLVGLEGGSLRVRQGDSVATVPLERINEIRLIRKSEVQVGDPRSAMAALMGADDEVYDLTPLEFGERVRAVQRILLYRPPDSSAAGP